MTGSGQRRKLHYTVDGPEAKIVFEERAKSVVAVLGTAEGASGTLAFRSSDLGPKRRTIVARVTKEGQELPAVTVAKFAARPLRPKAPKRLRIKVDRRRALAKVRWARDPLAERYDVKLTTKSGRRLTISVAKPKLVVPAVYKGDRIKVKVKGITRFKVSGPARSKSVRVTAAKRKGRKS